MFLFVISKNIGIVWGPVRKDREFCDSFGDVLGDIVTDTESLFNL